MRAISLYDLGRTTLQGIAVPESVVQTLGSRETKECLWTRMSCHPWERRGGLAGAELSICLPHRAGTIKPASSHLRQG